MSGGIGRKKLANVALVTGLTGTDHSKPAERMVFGRYESRCARHGLNSVWMILTKPIRGMDYGLETIVDCLFVFWHELTRILFGF